MPDRQDLSLVTTTWPGPDDVSPVVLLHGSGQDETAMLPFARAAFPRRTLLAVRGRIPWGHGFAFFRRRPDRILDEDDLTLAAAAVHGLLAEIHAENRLAPLVCGCSNGAITAPAAVLLGHRETVGSILLRPLSPWPRRDLPRLDGHSALLVDAADDERREPHDGRGLGEQLRRAGAAVEVRTLPIGHAHIYSHVTGEQSREAADHLDRAVDWSRREDDRDTPAPSDGGLWR